MKKSPLICKDAGAEAPIEARLVFNAPETADGEFMYMPAGEYSINASMNKKPVTAQVLVEKAAAGELNRQLAEVSAKSDHKPFFDFDHKDGAASFWPKAFVWRDSPKPGVYAQGEWSASGKAAIEGKDFRAFSPVFYVDDPKAKPARIVCNPEAGLNFGGLVNKPAFKEISPLWSKQAEEPETPTEPQDNSDMKKTLAELQAKLTTVESELTALKADKAGDEKHQAQIAAKESERAMVQKDVRIAELEDKETDRRKKEAKKSVDAAIARGAIAAKDEKTITRWTGLLESDPENEVLLASLPANSALGERITPAGSGIEAKEGPARTLKGYAEIAALNAKLPLNYQTHREKGVLARKMGALFAKEISGKKEFMDMPLEAADVTDANLGILSGTLVAQRTLELFKLQFPAINRVYNDFSDSPAQFKQVEATRIIVVPAVQTYDATLDATGRPKGWTTVVAAKTTDVLITLDEHIGIPVVFDSNQLASTVRRLFDEQAPAAAYALAKYFVEKIYKLMTPANFNAYALVNGAKVPTAYASYVKGQADFARSSLADLGAIFNPNEVPMHDRSVLLNALYYAQLSKDPSLVTFFAGQQAPGIVTDNMLPKLAGFVPIEAPNLTNNNNTANLVGFALQKSAIIAKTRLPNDYTTALPGSSYGSVTTITDPDIGISVMLVQYVNHTGGFAEWRIAAMLGAAVGDNRGGLCILSQ